MIEYGNHIHLSNYDRQTELFPSNFVVKLRKHLKTRRLTGIRQIGNDRTLVLQFSDGLFYLVFEFFSAGNILLLDDTRKILILQRVVNDANIDKFAVNEIYHGFDSSLFGDFPVYSPRHYTADDIKGWIDLQKDKIVSSKRNKVFSIHKLIFAHASHLSSELILKCLKAAHVDTGKSCLECNDLLSLIASCLNDCEAQYVQLLTSPKGCIISKYNDKSTEETPVDLRYLYEEYHPFNPWLNGDVSKYKIENVNGTYNQTLDKFYSHIESNRNELKIQHQKQLAENRLDRARNERTKQIQSLQEQMDINIKKGDCIIFNADLITQCIDSIKTLIDRSMDWKNIEKFIELEKANGNELAQMIQLPLNLLENKIKLNLPDVNADTNFSNDSDSDASDSDSNTDTDTDSDRDSDADSGSKSNAKLKRKQMNSSYISVWLDITLSPYANAKLYFDSKKTAETKQTKVSKNTELAIENAQRKIAQDLKKSLDKENETLLKTRTKYWFEKFYWFVTSDGYLCLSGRDDLQNDMLYYRYFNDNDWFVSSDVEGSLKVFIKNPYKGESVPPSTLWQSGMFSLSGSSSWNNKVSSSAWYISGTQVSKKDIDDNLLSPGRFNFKSKKEYMPAVQLVMGVGFYFIGDEDVYKKNNDKRVTRQQEIGLKLVLDNKKADIDNSVIKDKLLAETDENEDTHMSQDVEDNEVTPTNQDDEDSEDKVKDLLSNLNITKRGKKSKLKKIAKKYGDQDDQDRLMAMEALGTLKQKQLYEQEAQRQQQDKQEAYKQFENREKIQQRKKKQDEKEIRKYLVQETEETVDFLDILDWFVAKPNNGDVLENIIPVFAPWFSLQKFKYKIKIQPGNNKKGKSIDDMLAYLNSPTRKVDKDNKDPEMDWQCERELLKALTSNGLITILPFSKLKVVLPENATKSNSKGNKNNGKGTKSKKKK